MEVIRAETAGFCMGVDMALNKLDRLIQENGAGLPVRTLGPIIHNPQVLARYEAQGVFTAETPAQVPTGAHCVIRAHGIPRDVEQALRKQGVDILDATCPRVKKAQTLIARQCARGRTLLLYGEAEHPEVKGLLSYAGDDAVVFGSPEELDPDGLDRARPYVLAAQTTQDREIFDALARKMKADPGLDVEVLQTICDATKLRQEEAMHIAMDVDCMVVVGGRMSGNTRRLVQVCETKGARCVHVEIPDELPLKELRSCQRIGLTAGASTPKDIIDAVEAALQAI
ncbi:MAG: 4-hydroxy-3-methylbut-2-enyl diphosphate reductase [Desulfovibrio sp.]|nr:4-hydroxy-3-methylbut-2-enyl diphosphate reductase [Desulfovibrio sp.]